MRHLVAILMAVSLCFVLFVQDQTAVFEIGPTVDLPEMMTTANVAQDTEQPEHKRVEPVVMLLMLPSFAPPALVNDRPRRSVPLVQRLPLSNPPTAPPAA